MAVQGLPGYAGHSEPDSVCLEGLGTKSISEQLCDPQNHEPQCSTFQSSLAQRSRNLDLRKGQPPERGEVRAPVGPGLTPGSPGKARGWRGPLSHPRGAPQYGGGPWRKDHQAGSGRKEGYQRVPSQSQFPAPSPKRQKQDQAEIYLCNLFFSFPVKYSQVTKLPVGNKTRIKPSIKGG